jgi:hypothetical protein
MDVEAQVIEWIHQGLLNQILSDDIAQMARLMTIARWCLSKTTMARIMPTL